MKHLICTFILTFVTLSASAANISDKMPLHLVQYLQENKLWLPQYDNEASPEHQDLSAFFDELEKTDPNLNEMVDSIFNPIAQTNGFDKFPVNYLQKIKILRYYKNVSAKRARVDRIFNLLNKKYIEISAVLISTAEVKEYEPTLRRLMQQISTDQIKVVDLSPELRAEMLAQEKNEPLHGYMKNSDAYDDNYAVNGLYSEKMKIIAVDLLRPISESVVTLAHEIVHSSDPYVQNKKNTVQQLTSYVKQKFVEKITSLPHIVADQAVQAIMSDVFYEAGRPDLFQMVTDIANMRKIKIERNTRIFSDNVNIEKDKEAAAQKEAAEKAALKALMDDGNIQSWMSSIISSTVENEYRAYVLSLAVYHKLKHKYYILPSSAKREQFISNLTRHDFSFLKSLEASVNPFARGTELSKLFSATGELELQKKNEELAKKLSQFKSILEQHYLIQSEKLFTNVPHIYREALAVINSSLAGTAGIVKNDLIPDWTKPGQFDSPTNPYTVLTAKISTSTLLQFKLTLKDLLAGLKHSQEALLLMQAGILPLHNLNLGELKLLGLQRSNAPLSVVPDAVDDKVKTAFVENREVLSNLFAEQAWSPESLQDYNSIPQRELMKYLYQLHLAKSVFWLRTKFPIMKKNLVTLKVFGHKLNEKFYDSGDLTDERAAELKNEIQSMLNDSFMSAADLATIRDLTQELGLLYKVSAENKWNELAGEFMSYVENAKDSMMAIGVPNNVTLKSLTGLSAALVADLKKQILAEYPTCATSPYLMNLTTNKKFNMGGLIFRVTTICNNRQYYVLRQPGDHIGTVRAVVQDGRPNLSVFFESKPIALEPLQ